MAIANNVPRHCVTLNNLVSYEYAGRYALSDVFCLFIFYVLSV